MTAMDGVKKAGLSLMLKPSVVKEKFNIDDKELASLRVFGHKHRAEIDEFINDFYLWMQGLPEFPQFFKNAPMVERVKTQQVKYWHEFFDARITSDYLENRVHIGAVHAKIGLPIHSYCAAMSYSTEWWLKRMVMYCLREKDCKADDSLTVGLIGVFNKLIQLDITIVTKTYHQDTQRCLQETLDETQEMVSDITKVAEAVVEGDYTTKLSNESALSVAINKMIDALNDSAKESARDDWLKTGQAKLTEQLRGDLNMSVLCSNAIIFLTTYISAKVGAFYLLEGEDRLVLKGSYAYPRGRSSNTFEAGDGLIGQVVLDKKPMVVTNLPEGYLSISSGLGEADTTSLLIYPIRFNGHVTAIIEMGTFGVFDDIHLELLNILNETIAISIESANHREKLNELLKESWGKSRDLEVSQKLLQEKAQELQKSSKYKSEFLSNMSHELRTPLNSLLILAQFFVENDEGNFTEDQIEKATIIYNSGKDLLNLINSILDLSKAEAGKLEIELSVFELGELVQSLSLQLQPLAEKKNIHLNVALEEGLPEEILSDALRIEQILRNLLSNAIKFTEKGGSVSLKVFKPSKDMACFRGSAPDDAFVAFAVKDSGPGVSREDQSAIFEAFQQADGSISRKFGGTGLGLTIARQLTELLGGELTLDSALGEGSTFTLYLPLRVPEDGLSAKQLPETSGNECVEVSKKSNKALILVVVDNAAFEKIVISQIKENGLSYIVTRTIQEGLAKAKEESPAAIICDISLLAENESELMDQLYKDPLIKHIPVQLIASSDIKEKAGKQGAVGYFRAPFERDTLLALLHETSYILQEPIQDVLVVTDEIQSKVICDLIQQDGVRVTVVKSAEEAESMLLSQRMHCMILSLELPGMSGLALLDKLSQNAQIAQPPVIICASNNVTDNAQKRISQYAPSIVLKAADTHLCLIDKVGNFLANFFEKKSPQLSNTALGLEVAHEIDVGKLKGTTVLLVDDDMRNNIALGAYLRKQGFEIVTADNGELALKCLEKNDQIDLVLMDIMMPVMDGYEAMKCIRANKKYQGLPIIALTAKAMPEDREKCLKAGANDYLTKPVELKKLLHLMCVCMNK